MGLGISSHEEEYHVTVCNEKNLEGGAETSNAKKKPSNDNDTVVLWSL